MPEPCGQITLLLAELSRGNREAADRLTPLIYRELRRMAGSYMQRERSGHTLQATALVNEVYIRLLGGEPVPWRSRVHFFGVAANAMRQVLLDYARSHHAGKRGGEEARKVTIDSEKLRGISPKMENILAINEALERLDRIDQRQSRLIELRFFAGLSVEEAAEVMDVSTVTIKREWRLAKAWLHRELSMARAE